MEMADQITTAAVPVVEVSVHLAEVQALVRAVTAAQHLSLVAPEVVVRHPVVLVVAVQGSGALGLVVVAVVATQEVVADIGMAVVVVVVPITTGLTKQTLADQTLQQDL
jgi:hypothetical protein